MSTSPAPAVRNHCLDRLFPDEDVAVVDARYTADQPAPPLDPELAPLVANAVEARRREFSYGRCCARHALDAIGSGGGAVGRGVDRAPLWPTGTGGSISHTSGYAVAVATRHRDGHAVGIDAERTGAVGDDIVPHVLGEADIAFVAATDEACRDELTTAVFSAKEALFKAQYPLTGRWVGFDEVQITSIEADRSRLGGLLTIAPTAYSVIRHALCWPITAHWVRSDDVVVVGVSATSNVADGRRDG